MSDDLVKRLRAKGWVPVAYGSGNYLVHSDGRVFSLPRPRARGGVLKPTVAVGGYLRLTLHAGKEKKNVLVHHLVAEAFLGLRPDGYEVAHINGDPADNRADNLCFKTRTENERDKAAHGTLLRGERTPSRKLDWSAVCEIRQRQMTQRDLAAKFGIARCTIQRIQAGQTWRAQQ